MKKYLIIVMNVVLIAAIIGAVVFAVIKSMDQKNKEADLTPTVSETTADSTVAPSAPEKVYKVGIVQHGLGNASKSCYEGFISELNERGLLPSLDIVYIIEDNEEQCKQKIQNLVDEGCDLLYTIGRFASESAAKITKDVPIVFGAVNSPDEVGLVESNEVPGGNVTGVSSFTPCFEQIDLIKVLLPKTKTVAAIYSNTDADSVLQGIIASKEAERIGISCSQYPVDDEDGLKEALDKIKEAKTEVVYIPVDKFLTAHINTLNEFSTDSKIPVICGDQPTMELGAFATSEVNYISIGRNAAGMACDILFSGKSPSTLSVMYKHDCTNLVNKETMDKLGIKLPATALESVQIWEKPTEPPTQAETKPEAAVETKTQ